MALITHDVEDIIRLLAEKEKDLELAAKIGQELLERNRLLDEKIQQLEAQVRRLYYVRLSCLK